MGSWVSKKKRGGDMTVVCGPPDIKPIGQNFITWHWLWTELCPHPQINDAEALNPQCDCI